MSLISLSIPRLLRVTSRAATKFTPRSTAAIRKFCSDDFNGKKQGSDNFNGSEKDGDSEYFEDPTKTMWKDSYFDSDLDEEKTDSHDSDRFSQGRRFFESTRIDSDRVLRILNQDGHGFDARLALDELGISLSGLLVRKVLVGILKGINQTNKTRSAKLGYKFFAWSSQRNYEHTTDSYHLLMKIFAECEEFKAMSRLVDEMVGKGLPTTARTLNILICTCGEAGLAKRVIERFIKSRNFWYRPYKHSYNAIMITLVAMRQYRLIGWVHRKMLTDGQTPDVLTYNVALLANHRLGNKEKFRRLVDEMGRRGFSPDLHTHNVLLHAIGMGNKPLAALNLMDHMRETGIEPESLHYTTAMDGLSRAGNLEACRFFFDEVTRNGLVPDVPCYTVMVTAYVVAKKLEEARKVFDEMIEKGLAPRVFAYNAMIRGYCKARRFEEAFEMLGDMESKGVRPNFLVYSNLVNSLRKAKKNLEADRVVRHMVEKGQYVHMTKNFKRYKRG